MAARPLKLSIDCATGEQELVPFSDAEHKQYRADLKAVENAPAPEPSPMVQLVQTVLEATDFDQAKKKLAAWLAEHGPRE
jgi:hypothetical protein